MVMSASPNPILDSSEERIIARYRMLPEAEYMQSGPIPSFARKLGGMQAQISRAWSRAYYGSRESSAALVRNVKTRAQHLREDEPLTLIGVIAGSAFVIGIAAGVWRAQSER